MRLAAFAGWLAAAVLLLLEAAALAPVPAALGLASAELKLELATAVLLSPASLPPALLSLSVAADGWLVLTLLPLAADLVLAVTGSTVLPLPRLPPPPQLPPSSAVVGNSSLILARIEILSSWRGASSTSGPCLPRESRRKQAPAEASRMAITLLQGHPDPTCRPIAAAEFTSRPGSRGANVRQFAAPAEGANLSPECQPG
jgi:hypothetical protein